MTGKGVVAIGVSAGGVQTLQAILGTLPANLSVPVLVVQHLSPDSPGHLCEILNEAGPMPVALAKQGEDLQNGRVFLAPANRHMLIDGDFRVLLSQGPRENRARPAIDPLFRSVALAAGQYAIGVIGSGYLNDGTSGLQAIALMGGSCLVQSPADAQVADMPRSALRYVLSAHPLAASKIGSAIVNLIEAPPSKEISMSPNKTRREIEIEAAIAAGDLDALAGTFKLGTPALLTCPECHGALIGVNADANFPRYRCHTGHAFTADVLLQYLRESSENALWNAMRTLQETAILTQHLAAHSEFTGDVEDAKRLAEEARWARAVADKVPEFIRLPD